MKNLFLRIMLAIFLLASFTFSNDTTLLDNIERLVTDTSLTSIAPKDAPQYFSVLCSLKVLSKDNGYWLFAGNNLQKSLKEVKLSFSTHYSEIKKGWAFEALSIRLNDENNELLPILKKKLMQRLGDKAKDSEEKNGPVFSWTLHKYQTAFYREGRKKNSIRILIQLQKEAEEAE
jgi:hypothetical protein